MNLLNTLLDTSASAFDDIVRLSWKGAVLTLIVSLVLIMCRRHLSPAWRHGLWLLVLLRFIVPDMGTSVVSLSGFAKVPERLSSAPVELPDSILFPAEADVAEPAPPAVKYQTEAPPIRREEPVHRPTPTIYSTRWWSLTDFLMLGWVIGMVGISSGMVFLHLRLLYRIRRDSDPAKEEITDALHTACKLAGVAIPPRLIITDAIPAPALFGIIRPVILLPRDLASQGPSAALRLIFLHELAHLQRRDLWAQVVASLIVVLHWFNPVVWIAARRMRAEAEMAADAHALRFTDATEAHRLGEVLLGFAHRATAGWLVWFATSTLLGISENKRDLKRRIEALMDIAKGRRTRWIVGLGIFMLLAIVGLTKAPAEDAKKEQAKEVKPEASATEVSSVGGEKLSRVLGKIVDVWNHPVAGVELNLQINLLTGIGGGGSQRTKSDADGRFSFDKLPLLAEFIVSAHHPDHMESRVVRVRGYDPVKEILIVLPQTLWVTGKVTDKRSGKPIEDARVFYAMERTQSYLSKSFGRFDWEFPSIHTSKTGEYRLPIRARDAHQIIIRAWAPDMTSTAARIALEKAETVFNIQIEPEVQVLGKVVDAANKPVQDAYVFVTEDCMQIDESVLPLTLEKLRSKDRIKLSNSKLVLSTGYSKADGTVEVESGVPLLQQHQSLVALHPEHGLARMSATELKTGFVLKLKPWATLRGTVTEKDGKPLANSEISFTASAEPAEEGQSSFILRQNLKTITDEKGGFTLTRLAPDSLLDGFRAKGRIQMIRALEISSGPQTGASLTLQDQNLPFIGKQPFGKSRGVRGRIVFPPGHTNKSADYLTLLFFRSLNGGEVAFTRLQDDGTFITALQAPGFYELTFSATPKEAKKFMSRTSRWMRFRVEPNTNGEFLDLGEIRLTEKDFEPEPEAALAHQLPVYAEGPDAKIEVTLQSDEQIPATGLKVEIRDYLDINGKELRQTELAKKNPAFQTDKEGKVLITFQRRPRPDLRVHGVHIGVLRLDGAPEEPAKVMDGRKSLIKLRKLVSLELRTTPAIVSYTLSTAASTQPQSQPIQDGVIRTHLMLRNERAFILQGTTAEGRILFSEVQELSEDSDRVFKADLTLSPGIEISGKVNDTNSSPGFVIANSYIQGRREQPQLQTGFPPSATWTTWAPVHSDGSFRLPEMPRGRSISLA